MGGTGRWDAWEGYRVYVCVSVVVFSSLQHIHNIHMSCIPGRAETIVVKLLGTCTLGIIHSHSPHPHMHTYTLCTCTPRLRQLVGGL